MKERIKYDYLNFLVIFLLLCSSCARQVMIPYSSELNASTQIVLKPIKPTNRTFVTLNDSIIVSKKFIKSITIENVPSGTYLVNYISEVNTLASELDTTMTIVVQNQKKITKTIDVPPYNAWYYISNILIGLVLLIPLLII